MQCQKCGSNLAVMKTVVTKRGVRRKRACVNCSVKVVTYERLKEDGLNEHEMRIIQIYRKMKKPARAALWAMVRSQD